VDGPADGSSTFFYSIYFQMKFFFGAALVSSLFLYSFGYAQQLDSRAVKAKKEAGRFTADLLKKDYSGFVDLLYPPFVDSMGGKKLFIEQVSKSMKQAAASGAYPETFTVGDAIDFAAVGNKVAVTIPFELKLHEKGKETLTSTTGKLVGISNDNGKKWTFIDATSMRPIDILQFLPEFAGKLQVLATQPTPVR
jgi:hypothetical protein